MESSRRGDSDFIYDLNVKLLPHMSSGPG